MLHYSVFKERQVWITMQNYLNLLAVDDLSVLSIINTKLYSLGGSLAFIYLYISDEPYVPHCVIFSH